MDPARDDAEARSVAEVGLHAAGTVIFWVSMLGKIRHSGERLRQMMIQMIRNTTPQEADRRMQVFLAQARGKTGNGELLHAAMNAMIRARMERGGHEQ